MERLDYNAEILDILVSYIMNNPDIRFNQALYNLGINENDDKYNEESYVTYNRLMKNKTAQKIFKEQDI